VSGVDEQGRAGGWPWFVAWFGVGGAYTLAILGAMTIGIFVLPIAVVATVVLSTRERARIAASGLVSGAGLPLLYVAYLNRSGPGTVCTRSATESSCTDEWSPWPWLVVGLALVVAGVVIFVRRQRAQPARNVQRDAT
jgi:hypothetical protein